MKEEDIEYKKRLDRFLGWHFVDRTLLLTESDDFQATSSSEGSRENARRVSMSHALSTIDLDLKMGDRTHCVSHLVICFSV